MKVLIEKEFRRVYKTKPIFLLFTLIFFCNLVVNIDHGTMPACSIEIKEKVQIQNLKFGMLGSIVYVGLTFGSIFATGLFSKGKWIKPTLVASLLLNVVSLLLFTETSSFYVMVFFRAMIGFCQIFVCIFQPVWADTFGTEKQKSIFLTLLLLASPLGVVFGYTITYYMIQYYTWEYSFYVQALCLLPCAIILIFTPTKYIDVEFALSIKA
mmetsp:Transcript_2678/g.4508  ORF Transcript_2678/g.4508 Transcript_2678/m.4508 type:complete len:211 (+) Transcript_2678:290-922(+)